MNKKKPNLYFLCEHLHSTQHATCINRTIEVDQISLIWILINHHLCVFFSPSSMMSSKESRKYNGILDIQHINLIE